MQEKIISSGFEAMNYSIQRFIEAQDRPYSGYQQAFSEIQRGRKVGHWIWYIFPQVKGLGFSHMSEYYGISGLKEAKEYMADKILSNRLREITTALLAHNEQAAVDILGDVDAMKVKSSMTLFDAVFPNDIFDQVLNQFYGGERCQRTLRAIEDGQH